MRLAASITRYGEGKWPRTWIGQIGGHTRSKRGGVDQAMAGSIRHRTRHAMCPRTVKHESGRRPRSLRFVALQPVHIDRTVEQTVDFKTNEIAEFAVHQRNSS